MSWQLGIQHCAALANRCVYALAINDEAIDTDWFARLFLQACTEQTLSLVSYQPDLCLQHPECSERLTQLSPKQFQCYHLQRQQLKLNHLLKALSMDKHLQQRLLLLHLPADFVIGSDQVQQITTFCQRYNCMVMLLLPGDHALLSLWRDMQTTLSGLASLSGGAQGVLWQQHYWINHQRVSAEHRFYLNQSQHSADKPESSQSQAPALIVAEKSVLSGQKVVPSHWLLAEDVSGVISLAAQNNAKAIILAFTTEDALKKLVFSLHKARSTLGSEPSIFIRETQQVIRLQDERLLLRLGANAVLPKALDFSRCLRLLHSYFGNADYIADSEEVESLYQTTRTVNKSGYLAPLKFCQQAIAAVERSVDIAVQNSLLKFEVINAVGMVESLATFNTLRDGDFISNGGNFVYVYFHACPSADVDFAIAKVLRLSAQLVFASEQRYCDHDAVLWQLRDLQRLAQSQVQADHSEALARRGEFKRESVQDFQHESSVETLDADLFAQPVAAEAATPAWQQYSLLSSR